MKLTSPFGSIRTTGDFQQRDLALLMADYPVATQVATIKVIRGIYRAFPPGMYHWRPDKESDLVIEGLRPDERPNEPTKPHILVGLNQSSWMNASMNRKEPLLNYPSPVPVSPLQQVNSDAQVYGVTVYSVSKLDTVAHQLGHFIFNLLLSDRIRQMFRIKAADGQGGTVRMLPTMVRVGPLQPPASAGKIMGEDWKGWFVCVMPITFNLVHRSLVGSLGPVYNDLVKSIELLIREEEPPGDIKVNLPSST